MAIQSVGRPDERTIRAIFEPLSGRARAAAPIKDGDAPGRGTVLATLFSSLAPLNSGAGFGLGSNIDVRR